MAKIKPALTKYQAFAIERVQRSQLSFMPGNPQGMDETQTAALLAALDVNAGGVGLLQTIVVNKATMRIVGGNHRIIEIDGLEMYDQVTHANDYSIDVAMIDVSEDREKAIVLALNNPRLSGQPKIDALREFLGHVPESERDATGFTADDCSFLLSSDRISISDRQLSVGEVLWGTNFNELKQPTQREAPEDFPEIDESIPTEHECPKCGYRFSGGKAKPVGSHPEAEVDANAEVVNADMVENAE